MSTIFDSFILRPLRAQLALSATLFKKKFYVVISIGQSNFKTQVDGNGGKHPHWRDHFIIKENNKRLPMSVKLYRKNLIFGDKLQAEALLLLEQIFPSHEASVKTVELFNNKTKVGEIAFEVQGVVNSTSITSIEDKKRTEECSSFRENLTLPSDGFEREEKEAKTRKEELLEMKLNHIYERMHDQSQISSGAGDNTRRPSESYNRNPRIPNFNRMNRVNKANRVKSFKDMNSQLARDKSSEFSLCSIESLFDRSSKQLNTNSNFNVPSYMKPTVRSIVNRGSEAIHRKLPPIS